MNTQNTTIRMALNAVQTNKPTTINATSDLSSQMFFFFHFGFGYGSSGGKTHNVKYYKSVFCSASRFQFV